MELYNKIKTARMLALKSKDVVAKNALSRIMATVDTQAIKLGVEKSDELVKSTISKQIKAVADELQYRPDAKAELDHEVEVLSVYLPQSLAGEQLEVLVKSKCLELNVENMGGMGKVMGYLKQNYSDFTIDGAEVKRYVMEHINA
ncbi:tRNA amidotransferase [Vibrio phage D479]